MCRTEEGWGRGGQEVVAAAVALLCCGLCDQAIFYITDFCTSFKSYKIIVIYPTPAIFFCHKQEQCFFAAG